MRLKIVALILTMSTFLILATIPLTLSSDGIAIIYGDHFELVCRNDGLIDVSDTILQAINVTETVKSSSARSFKGTLVGSIRYEYDPEIQNVNVSNFQRGEITTILVNFSVTMKPLKFSKLKLIYTVRDLLKFVNGTWYLRYSFNSDAVSPPQVVVKIPKAPVFNKLVVENTIPAPHVFLEETNYYILVWNSPLFKYENTSMTYIDISYKTVLDYDSILYWLGLTLASSVISLSVLAGIGKRIKSKLFRQKGSGQRSEFEIFKDKTGKFRFRMKAPNGEIITTSEAYESKQACTEGIALIKKSASGAGTEDRSD